MLQEAGQLIRELNQQLEEGVSRAYSRFLNELVEHHGDSMKQVARGIMDLDVHATCALNAYDFRHCRPGVRTPHDAEERSSVRAKGMRHPVIEIVQDGREYVPNNFEVGTPDCCGALLYGLNAAGKSPLVKSLGVNVLLAQAGMYVAADAFELVPYTQLLSRVSTGDDIIMGHSTFINEMSELHNILTRAGARSLVIGDELCAGTVYNSGLSIVAAGLQALSRSQLWD